LIIVGVIAVVATVGGGIYMLANSEAATAAKAFVEANGVVRNELGEPVTTSFAGGVINTSSGVNTATIEVNATGPRGSGKATVELRSRGSEPWVVTSGRLEGGPSGSVRLEPPG
jgi:formylmethanofuran:tetrahydromethanopterin formyltransferase